MQFNPNEVVLHDKDIVTVTISGKILDLTFSEHRSKGSNITPLSKELYMNNEGEVFEFQKSETRADNLDGVKRSMATARNIINSNCMEPENLRWLTLTYAENMQDCDRLYVDVKVFIAKMRKQFGHFEYVIAIEPQGRGAWHAHCILIFSSVAPYMANSVIADLWGHGFVNIQSVADVDNIGAYLSAYMADVELSVEGAPLGASGEIVEREVNGVKKKFIKGARLHFYPSGMHIFRYSRGLKRPVVKVMTYKQAMDIVKAEGKALSYSNVCSIQGEDFYNLIKKESYK